MRRCIPRLDALLETCLTDNRDAWELRADGTYRQRTPGTDPERSAQVIWQRDCWGRRALRQNRSARRKLRPTQASPPRRTADADD